MKRAAPRIRVMVEEKDDRSRWAWDTAPTDGSPRGPVYIGDKEDWSHEETVRRRDTNRNPWGGVWTQPLRKGATKAKWGKTTFDSGRYRCCDDLHDCGVFVAVKQGPVMAWHFQRQWSYGVNNSKAHNQNECQNGSRYKGPGRFHNIVVNELYNHLQHTYMLGNKSVAEIRKEPKFNARPKDGEPFVFEPDIFLELPDGKWYTIEVIDTHAPERRVHEYCGLGLIEINLNELDCYGNDREFSKWVQGGGVQKILDFEFSSIQRRRRWGARDKKWKGKDERDLRVLEGHISKCKKAYGFDLDFDLESTNIEQVTLAFQEEVAKRERIKKAERNRELEAIKARANLLTEIYYAVQRNIEKYGERIPRATRTYSSVDEVDRSYEAHWMKVAQHEQRQKDILAEVKRCELLYGLKGEYVLSSSAHNVWNSLTDAGAVEPYFRIAKANEKAKLAEKARAEEWRQVGYLQAIAQLEKEFGVTEEEVGIDSSFNLEEIRENFQWSAHDKKKEEEKKAKQQAEEREKSKKRSRARTPPPEDRPPIDRTGNQVQTESQGWEYKHVPTSESEAWGAVQRKRGMYRNQARRNRENREQNASARKQAFDARKQARDARKQESKRASKDMTPEEDKKGYLKQLEKLQNEVNRTGLTARQSREAQGNLDRFLKANKGKYENDES